MSDKPFTYAFKFGRKKVTAFNTHDYPVDLTDWQMAWKHQPEEKAFFESETEARDAVTSFLKEIVQEENTFYTPDRPVSARWIVYKLEKADHGTMFWYRNNTVE